MPNRRGRTVKGLTALVAVGALVGLAQEPATAPRDPRPVATAPVASASASVSPGVDGALGDQRRPNIVVIMADDMREDELQYMPRTRALLGLQGTRFVNSFSPHPQCCPARASFVTGQYTHNHQVWSNRGLYGGFQALDDTDTMPVALHRAGYTTAFAGKYLNGYGIRPFPDGSDSRTYIPPGWSDWRASVRGIYRYFNPTLNVNGTLRSTPRWYQTRMFGAEVEDMIGRSARSPRPFFLWAAYVAPHVGTPEEVDDPEAVERDGGGRNGFLSPAVPAGVRGMFDETITRAPGADGEADVGDKPYFISKLPPTTATEQNAMAEVSRQRAESLEVLDQEVENTVVALDRAGELDDTVVIFTADNGYFLGEHRIRQGKLLPYDPALRVPLLVRGPGIPTGEERTDPVTTIDFAPTFLQLAGIAPDPDMDGLSFLDPDASDDPTADTGWVRAIMTQTGPRTAADTTADGRLPPGADPVRFTEGVRTERYLYVEHATGERELYDLRRDPDQFRNVIDRPVGAPVVAELAALLDELRVCRGQSCRARIPRSLRR